MAMAMAMAMVMVIMMKDLETEEETAIFTHTHTHTEKQGPVKERSFPVWATDYLRLHIKVLVPYADVECISEKSDFWSSKRCVEVRIQIHDLALIA